MKKQTRLVSWLLLMGAGAITLVFSPAWLTHATVPDAAATFNSKCASCHGKDGRGKTLKGRLSHARDLTSGEWQNDVTDERLFNSISNGRGKMPSFKKKLTEAQIEELVSYVRRLKR